MDRRVTPPKQVTSPTWGPPPPCKQARSEDLRIIVRSIIKSSSKNYNNNEVMMTIMLLTCRHFRIMKTYMRNVLVWTKYSYLTQLVEKVGTRAKTRNEGGGRGEKHFLFSPPTHPSFALFPFFPLLYNVRAITWLETLATQAINFAWHSC